MLHLMWQLARPQISRVRWWIWAFATVVLVAWGIEWFSSYQTGFVSKWLVPIAFVALVLSYFLDRRFWHLPIPIRDDKSRIVIVGAGPAGLSAAYFLRLLGYREVLVLEKQGRAGGLCRTITEDYYSIDLGANYVTPAYTETMRLADEVGAELYIERPFTTIDFTNESTGPKFVEPWNAVRINQRPLPYIGMCLKYLWLRYWLGGIVDEPGHARIHEHPELCVTFLDWLKRHNLEPLQTLFEAPITVMGYGYLHEIAAPYALKYMNVATFSALALKALPITKHISPWPKRFVLGFQRLWEAIAWNLNVQYNVDIHWVKRSEDGIVVNFSHQEQVLDSTEPHRDTLEFDYLILACPMSHEILDKFGFSEQERELFVRVQSYSYCLTSFMTKGVKMPQPIAASLPLPAMGKPWAITQQFPESNVFQFYSRVPPELLDMPDVQPHHIVDHPADTPETSTPGFKESIDPVRGKIVGEVRKVIELLEGKIDNNQWHTYDRWCYFQHVTATDMRDGFYQKLEALQGTNRTFYTGALLNFELVECSIAYSKQLVNKHFRSALGSSKKRAPKPATTPQK